MFKNVKIVENQGVKYSDLLNEFMSPFFREFESFDNINDMLEFSIVAWNFGNMKLIFPHLNIDGDGTDVIKKIGNEELLMRLVEYKVDNFKEYTNFIISYEIKEFTETGMVLNVLTQERDTYLEHTLTETAYEDDYEDDYESNDFEENFINRCSIIIKPKQPFLDWCAKLHPDDIEDMNQTNTYLVDDKIEDVEVWLRNKFDKIFMFELDLWHRNKKEWPQKRSYKMFKEWFDVDISMLVFDLEKRPVFKSE